MRVALLSPCFWPEVRRGSERFVRDLADGLIARGHEPRLITSHAGRPSRAVEDGLPVVRHWRPPARRLRAREYEDHLTHVPFSYLELRAGRDDVACRAELEIAERDMGEVVLELARAQAARRRAPVAND